MEKNTTFRLGGRWFERVKCNSIERELYWTNLVHRAQLDVMTPRPDETEEQYLDRVRIRLISHGVYVEFLCTQVVPRGARWTVEGHREVVEYIGGVWNGKDKAFVYGLFPAVARELLEGGTIAPWRPGGSRR